MDDELKDLFERCKAEERSAQTALYRRFSSKVFATALRYTDSRDEAADIAQESWVKVFRHLTKFKEFNSLKVGCGGSRSTQPSPIIGGI